MKSVVAASTHRGKDHLLLLGPAFLGPASIWATNSGRNADPLVLFGAGLTIWLAGMSFVGTVRNRMVGGLVGAQFATLAFWGWSAVPANSFSSAVGDAAAGLVVGAMIGWLASRLRSFDWLPAVVGVGVGVASLSMVVTGVFDGSSSPTWPDPSPPVEFSGARAGEDILILVLDAHASPAVLADQFNYDMGPTLTRMKEAGLTPVEDAYSNYTMTHFSVPSLLSLGYLVEPGVDESPDLSAMTRRVIAGDAGLMAWMSDIGYYVTKFESGWEEDECGAVFRCVSVDWRGNVTTWLVVSGTPLRALWPSHPYPSTALAVLEILPEVVADAATNNRPDFIMAHVLSPHSPLFLTADCSNRYVFGLGGLTIGNPGMPATVAEGRAQAYVGQVDCVGTHLAALAEVLEGTDTVVLIAGDHGSDFGGQSYFPLGGWTDSQLTERFAVFAAVRVPAGCGEAPETLVNLARYTMGCVLDVDLPQLEDRFLGSGGKNAPLVDVTERVLSTRR